MNIQRYEFAENIVDTQLFASDELPFSVLQNIVNNKSQLVVTDHESFIVCYSGAPHPLWIWSVDGLSEEKMDQIWNVCKKEGILPGYFPESMINRIDMKYELAEYFMKKSQEITYGITMNLLVYECFKTVPPTKQVDGALAEVRPEDVDEVADFLYEFYRETGIYSTPRAECLEKAHELVGLPTFHLWQNAEGENVAMCSGKTQGEFGKIALVYCKPSARRKGYVQQMVYEVTEEMLKQGLRPVLYTDGDYAASNGCYKKVGYEEQGGLCTLGIISDKDF